MKRLTVCFLAASLCLVLVTRAASAKPSGGGPGYTLVQNPPGSATLVHPDGTSATAVQLTSTGASGWGGIGFAVPKGLTLRDVNNLSTDYQFVAGSCWEGSPRFTVGVIVKGKPRELHFYIGPAPSYTGCPPGVWANTGNLAGPSSVVDDSELPGGSPADPYSGAEAKYGGYAVSYIAIDLDGGFSGTQTVDFENTQVDGTLYTYAQ